MFSRNNAVRGQSNPEIKFPKPMSESRFYFLRINNLLTVPWIREFLLTNGQPDVIDLNKGVQEQKKELLIRAHTFLESNQFFKGQRDDRTYIAPVVFYLQADTFSVYAVPLKCIEHKPEHLDQWEELGLTKYREILKNTPKKVNILTSNSTVSSKTVKKTIERILTVGSGILPITIMEETTADDFITRPASLVTGDGERDMKAVEEPNNNKANIPRQVNTSLADSDQYLRDQSMRLPKFTNNTQDGLAANWLQEATYILELSERPLSDKAKVRTLLLAITDPYLRKNISTELRLKDSHKLADFTDSFEQYTKREPGHFKNALTRLKHNEKESLVELFSKVQTLVYQAYQVPDNEKEDEAIKRIVAEKFKNKLPMFKVPQIRQNELAF